MSVEQIRTLAEQVLYHKRLYYNGEPEISDAEYDALENKLRDLDPENPVLHMVGSDETGKVHHEPPMLSCQKAYSLEEVMKWAMEVRDSSLYVGYKVDGLSMSLVYQDGKLVQGSTRGNGQTGDDETTMILMVDTIPKTIPAEGTVNVRGEIYLKRSSFNKINAALPDEEKYASPRNLATGTLKQKDVRILRERQLDFMAFELLGYQPQADFDKHVTILRKWGFDTADIRLIEGINQEQLQAAFDEVYSQRDQLDFEIDGVVFKYNRASDRDAAGVTSHHPKWQMAWKFKAQGSVSTLIGIDWQIGRTGVLTPVGRVEPVEIANATVSNVTLHNHDFLVALGAKVGDEVAIVRAGEVIPKIVEVVSEGDGTLEVPEVCPSCGQPISFEGVNLVCTNLKCRERVLQTLEYWVRVVDIKGLGPANIQKLYDEGLVRHPSEFYDKRLTTAVLEAQLGKNGIKIKREIEHTRNLPFARFLQGLGIPNLGKSLGKVLAAKYKSFDDLLKVSIEELCTIEGISDVIASSIKVGLEQPDRYQPFFDHGLTIEYGSSKAKKRKAPAKPQGLDRFFKSTAPAVVVDEEPVPDRGSIYITGSIKGRTKNQLEEEMEQAGFTWQTSISSTLDYLVAGENAGEAKLDKARKKGIKVLTWEELQSLIKQK